MRYFLLFSLFIFNQSVFGHNTEQQACLEARLSMMTADVMKDEFKFKIYTTKRANYPKFLSKVEAIHDSAMSKTQRLRLLEEQGAIKTLDLCKQSVQIWNQLSSNLVKKYGEALVSKP